MIFCKTPWEILCVKGHECFSTHVQRWFPSFLPSFLPSLSPLSSLSHHPLLLVTCASFHLQCTIITNNDIACCILQSVLTVLQEIVVHTPIPLSYVRASLKVPLKLKIKNRKINKRWLCLFCLRWCHNGGHPTFSLKVDSTWYWNIKVRIHYNTILNRPTEILIFYSLIHVRSVLYYYNEQMHKKNCISWYMGTVL